VFKWAVENELVPASVFQALAAVRGLQKGRTAARETGPVKPVPEAFVDAVLPLVPGPVRAMIELQLLTGMRPGEVVILRAIDLDMTGKVWLYRPGSDQEHGTHKTAWRGHHRVVAIGPRAQGIVKGFLKTDLHAYLFSPQEALAEILAAKRQKRKTKVQPSQQNRRKKHPKRKPGERYTVAAYRTAISRACDQAFPPPEHLRPQRKPNGKRETRYEFRNRLTPEEKAELKEWRKAHRWHPHRLRHTKATEIRREAGLDAARAVLGHRSPVITAVYAELDTARAVEVMERLG
jgi:integrase